MINGGIALPGVQYRRCFIRLILPVSEARVKIPGSGYIILTLPPSLIFLKGAKVSGTSPLFLFDDKSNRSKRSKPVITRNDHRGNGI